MTRKKKDRIPRIRWPFPVILVLVFFGGVLLGFPDNAFAVDPEIEEMERQLKELEAKKREETRKEQARRKARRAVKKKPKVEAPAPEPAPREEETVRERVVADPTGSEGAAVLEFVRIKPGCFDMGSSSGYGDERRHRVCITRSFELGRYEVTQGQWQWIMGENPSHFSNCGPDCPVENVSWNQIQEYIRELNRRTGLSYRLPTEAEWEFACRSGGADQNYCGGGDVDQLGWHTDNSEGRTHRVGEKYPNGLGLYDMSGNVWEWVQDRYDSDYYSRSPVDNPEGSSEGSLRVFRGGSWYNYPGGLRSTYRGGGNPDNRGDDLGFRLAITR